MRQRKLWLVLLLLLLQWRLLPALHTSVATDREVSGVVHGRSTAVVLIVRSTAVAVPSPLRRWR